LLLFLITAKPISPTPSSHPAAGMGTTLTPKPTNFFSIKAKDEEEGGVVLAI
jgi:hypothetical protein